MRDTLIGALAGSALVLTTSSASAREEDAGGFLLPGFLFAPGASRALGAEISYAHYPYGCCYGVGPRVSAEWLQPRGPFGGTYRGALGAEVFAAGFGLEASFTRQGARDNGPRADYGAAFGAFASLGFASIGVRHSQSFRQGDASETSMVITLKWMILVYGENPYGSIGSIGNWSSLGRNWGQPVRSGRPMIVGASRGEAAHVVVAPLVAGPRWDTADVPASGNSAAGLRERLLALLA